MIVCVCRRSSLHGSFFTIIHNSSATAVLPLILIPATDRRVLLVTRRNSSEHRLTLLLPRASTAPRPLTVSPAAFHTVRHRHRHAASYCPFCCLLLSSSLVLCVPVTRIYTVLSILIAETFNCASGRFTFIWMFGNSAPNARWNINYVSSFHTFLRLCRRKIACHFVFFIHVLNFDTKTCRRNKTQRNWKKMRPEFPERAQNKMKMWVRRCAELNQRRRQNNETIALKGKIKEKKVNRSDGREGIKEDYLTGAASVSGVFPVSTKSGRDEQTGRQDDTAAG